MRRGDAVLVMVSGLMVGVLAAPTLLASGGGDKHDAERSEEEVSAALILPSVDTVFVPIAPVRAFDSRVSGFPGFGILPRLTSRVIPVKDGRSTAGAITAPDVIPVGATAIAYNLTVASATGPNFLAVTPGDAGSFTASAINFNGQADVANAGIVPIDATRSIKVWNGDQAGSTHFIVDLTGYFIERDMWAKVDADTNSATLLHGHGAVAAGSIATGIFSVTFDRSVVGCGWMATRNDNLDGVSLPGEVSIELGSSTDPTTLWVRTFDSAGNAVDPSSSDGFTLFVDC